MDRGFTELIAKDVRTRSELEYLRGAGSRDTFASSGGICYTGNEMHLASNCSHNPTINITDGRVLHAGGSIGS